MAQSTLEIRDEQDYVTIYIAREDRNIVLTPNWLGVIGFMYSGAFIGSAIFSEITWSMYHQESLRALIKATIATDYEIIVDSENFMSWDVRGIRSALQDFDMQYNVYYLHVPSFLFNGPISQVYSFLKGYALGQFSKVMQDHYDRFRTLPLDVVGYELYQSLRSLLDAFEIDYSTDVDAMTITLNSQRLTQWIINQGRDFTWI